MSGSVSGLSEAHRAEARHIVAKGAALLLAHPNAIHYTQGSHRWEGIDRHLLVSRGQFPDECDCSSTATWLLWNALAVRFGVRDVVNGTHWRAGFTGTMLNHGKIVVHRKNIKVGDQAIYGRRGTTGSHVVTCLGGGVGLSHGSERGPLKVDLDYRGDLMVVRRYI
jgi:hypothetical protein